MKIKKILSLLLCLCMIAGFIPFVAKKAEAATAPTDAVAEIKKYKDLLDSGIITEEEFTAKKKQLMGI